MRKNAGRDFSINHKIRDWFQYDRNNFNGRRSIALIPSNASQILTALWIMPDITYAPTGMTNDTLSSPRWYRATGSGRRDWNKSPADPLARLPISGLDSFEHVREENPARARPTREQIARDCDDFPNIYLWGRD